ncbi:sensor histidine kinase [Streptomyces sp. 4N509B]|uniref:sensor histidine kinase n=1 Tax=Streptomyces sp. 4N509B TaxID=3457413 RepID=UPI003FD411F2
MSRRSRARGRVSLRTRLTLIHGGLFLAAGVVLLAATYVLFNQRLHGESAQFTATEEPGDATGDATGDAAGGPSAEAPTSSPERNTSVVTGDGGVLTGDDATRWLANEQEALHDAATTSLLTQGGIALLLVVAVAAGLGWLVAGRVLAPLHRVTDTARRIAAAPAADRGLHERIALRGPDDEVKDLADAFDTMVDRLDRSFDGQRRFVANASHELRTPLTLGRALVEMAMHRPTASVDVRRLGEELLEINDRHERLIAGLLLLADAEHALPERRPVDLADIAAHVAARAEPEARRAGVTLHETVDEAPTSGDALLLERLVHNLVENGIRHNTVAEGGGWVRVTTGPHDGGHAGGDGRVDSRVAVRVVNTGPVVPPYEIPSLFEPFRRASAATRGVRGTGLGLSIVRAVAHAHGGEVTALPRDGGGLVVTVTLPRHPGAARAPQAPAPTSAPATGRRSPTR